VPKNKRTRLKDVASYLGVSRTLISIVLSGKAKQYRISEKMEKLVLATVKEMNYSPNLVAQNLRGGKSQLIGVIVTDISNPFYSDISRIIENRADEFNYTVLFSSSDEDLNNTKRIINVLINKGVEGLIIVPCDGSEEIIKSLYDDKIPIVLIDRHFPNLDVGYSCLNNFKSTVLATEHLIEQGYENISLVAYETEMNHIIDRIAGYEDTMIKSGLKNKINVERVNIINAKFEIRQALDYLIHIKKSDAVIFTTNLLAISGIYYLNEVKIKIPSDIAVVGFNRNDVFNLFYSPITYINQPIDQIAREAVDILIDKMKNGENSMKSTSIAEPELIIQNSSLKKSS
jgi:LacI family transcriptional regulator